MRSRRVRQHDYFINALSELARYWYSSMQLYAWAEIRNQRAGGVPQRLNGTSIPYLS